MPAGHQHIGLREALVTVEPYKRCLFSTQGACSLCMGCQVSYNIIQYHPVQLLLMSLVLTSQQRRRCPGVHAIQAALQCCDVCAGCMRPYCSTLSQQGAGVP